MSHFTSRLTRHGITLRCVYLLVVLCVIYWSLSCTQALRGPDDTLTPLAKVRVTLALDELDEIKPEVRARLRVGVIWAGINVPSEWCAEQLNAGLSELLAEDEKEPNEEEPDEEEPDEESPPEITPELIEQLTQLLLLCPDPLGFSPALAGPTAAISTGETRDDLLEITLTFTSLPPTDVIIGTPDARVAYATVVVFEDLDEDGALDLGSGDVIYLPSVQDALGDEGRDDRNDGRDDRRRDVPDWFEEGEPDTVYGATFTSLLSSHTRLVFREGDFVESFFYPLGGCEPPRGFSVVEVAPSGLGGLGALLGMGGGSGEASQCVSSTLDESAIALKVSGPSPRLQEVACAPGPVKITRASEVGSLSDELIEEEQWALSCLSPVELIVSVADAPCKSLSSLRLVDCPTGESECASPAWDDRASPPAWWPCAEALTAETVNGEESP